MCESMIHIVLSTDRIHILDNCEVSVAVAVVDKFTSEQGERERQRERRIYRREKAVSASENQNDVSSGYDVSMETSRDCSIETSMEEHSSPSNVAKKFIIQFSSKQWNTINPTEVTYARKRKGSHTSGVRKYKTLQPGLCKCFQKKLRKERKFHANLFSKTTNYSTGETFVKIQGKCSICTSTINAVIKREPEDDEPVKVNAKVFRIKVHRHKNKTAEIKVTSKIAERV